MAKRRFKCDQKALGCFIKSDFFFFEKRKSLLYTYQSPKNGELS